MIAIIDAGFADQPVIGPSFTRVVAFADLVCNEPDKIVVTVSRFRQSGGDS